MVSRAARASSGVSKLPSHPPASRPTRFSAPGALPPSQMSSGLAGSGPDVRTIDGEEFAAQRHAFCISSSLISRSDLPEHILMRCLAYSVEG
jgi:hypothetical protein